MKRFIEDYKGRHYDIIVIGGGITGACIAYDAASRGLSVAMVEKGDFSGATSASTSKLIHGGMRYLANMEVGLVRESLKERRVLENIAPNFVYPFPMMMLHNNKHLKNNRWFVKCGLELYDVLAFDKARTWDASKKIPNHKTISRKKVIEKQPNVKKGGLTGASLFYDCISIFPERLTLAFIKSAGAYGAHVSNYTKAQGFLIDKQNKVTGVRVHDLINNKGHEITSTVTINCGGPWADIVLGMAGQDYQPERLRRSEGIHIITRGLINDTSVVGSMTQGGRHIFLVPWRGHTLIGTTDKEYIGSPDEYRVKRSSITELIDDVNACFDVEKITIDDVLHTYGGLRPLVEDQTEETYTSSRKYEIYDNAPDGLDGLITVEGGKYTTSRNLAQNVMNIVWKKLPEKAFGHTITDRIYLKGSEIRDMNRFINSLKQDRSDFKQETTEYLGRNYGTESGEVFAIADKDKTLAETLNSDGEIMAQVVYAAKNEMALKLSDIVLRRTGIATLGNPGEQTLRKVANVAGKVLGWNKKRIGIELAETIRLLEIPAD